MVETCTNCFHLKAVTHIGYKKPRALRDCQSLSRRDSWHLHIYFAGIYQMQKTKGQKCKWKHILTDRVIQGKHLDQLLQLLT